MCLRVLQSNVFPHFVDARLKDITVLTTIVWGENDGVTLRYYVDKLQTGIAAQTLKAAAPEWRCRIRRSLHE